MLMHYCMNIFSGLQGIIKNGDVVAVKKLSVDTHKAKADFESEVRLISNVNHRNIIRLLGCSCRGSELLLVFEYMANGSLDRFVYGKIALNFYELYELQ